MLWTSERQFPNWPFEQKSELESAVLEARADLFGDARIYLDARTLGPSFPTLEHTPDGYLIDLSSRHQPVLYLIEIELASHDPLRYVAQHLLSFYLAARGTPDQLRAPLRQAVQQSAEAWRDCEEYVSANGFASLDDFLDELMVPESLRALVIVDAIDDEFARGLRGALKIPIELLPFRRFRSLATDEVVYEFEPFLHDLGASVGSGDEPAAPVDPAELDTIVVAAQETGFNEVFLGEHMWQPVRIPESMLSKIRFIAGYQLAPVSAITHVAEVGRIEPCNGSSKYAVYFKSPAQKMGPIQLVPDGKSAAPHTHRYTSFARLCRAHTLDEVF